MSHNFEPDTSQPSQQATPSLGAPRRVGNMRRRILLIGGIFSVIVLLVFVSVAAYHTFGPKRDEHAKAACSAIQDAQQAQMFDAVILELKAITEAGKSANADLRAAAAKKSPASDLPPDNPLYENPGDVKAQAVANWCSKNPY